MRNISPRGWIGIAALILALPVRAQQASSSTDCPQAPAASLLQYVSDFASSAPISTPITQAQLDGQIDALLAAPEPASVSLSTAELRDALVSALNNGVLMRGLDSKLIRPRTGAAVLAASVVIMDPGIVEVMTSSRTKEAGYAQTKLAFRDRATGGFPALLLTPKGRPGPYPAILGLPGRSETPQDFAQRFMGVELAKKGYVVLIPDFSLSDECDSDISSRLLREGFTLLGIRTYQALLAMKYLRAAANVQPDRVAVIGHADGSGIASLVVRLRSWSTALIEDYQTDFRDAGAPASGERIRRGTVPALFPISSAVNDRSTLQAPLLALPLGYAKPAYHREISSFLGRALRRARHSAAPANDVEPTRLSEYLHRALDDLRSGQKPQASEEIEAALEIWQTQRLVLPANDAGPKLGIKTMGWFVGYALERIRTSPASERLALVKQLALLRPEDADLALARARLEFKAGLREQAAKSLDLAHALAQKGRAADPVIRVDLADAAMEFGRRQQAAGFLGEAEALSPDSAQLSRIADIYLRSKDYAGALRASNGIPGPGPGDSHAWLARAQAAWSAGQRDLAQALLDKAPAPGPDKPQDLLAAAILRKNLGDATKALELLRGAAKSEPDDVPILMELAGAANGAGDRALALDSLDHAQSLTHDKTALRRIAGLYQDVKENDKALALLERLTLAHHLDANLYLDRGICEFGMNRSTEAVSSLKTAIRLNPRLWEAYLSLGAVYDAQNLPAKAAVVYDRALAVKPAKENDPLFQMIRKNRAGGR